MSSKVWSGRSKIRSGIVQTPAGRFRIVLELWPDAEDRETRRRFVSNRDYEMRASAMEQYRTKLKPFLRRLRRRLEEGVPIDNLVEDAGLADRLRRVQ
jgi:hypothetical protein